MKATPPSVISAPVTRPLSAPVPKETVPAAAAPVSSNPNISAQPTTVLRLANMVSREELSDPQEYEDILSDIADEVEEKYGKIRSIIAPRPVPGDASGDPPAVGIIFVAFDVIEGAVLGQSRLNGRGFDDAVVEASFYNEKAFARSRFL